MTILTRNRLLATAASFVFLGIAGSSAHATVLVQDLSGSLSNTLIPGQSITTPTLGAGFDDLTFSFFHAANTPIAAGSLFILDTQYLGKPSALSSATPGFVAKSTGISGGAVYIFAGSVTLNPNTQYFFYANQSMTVLRSNPSTYAGGKEYFATTQNSNFAVLTGGTSDANFRLSGTVTVPEGSTVALLGLALPLIGAVVVRRRRSAI